LNTIEIIKLAKEEGKNLKAIIQSDKEISEIEIAN
jgi:hypothetical protein